MGTRKSLAFATLVFLAGLNVLAGNSKTLVGAVTTVTPDSVQVKTDRGEERAVTLDAKTQYVLWITHQPWQRSTVADHSSVKTGRCVSIDLRGSDDYVAKVVRINTDEIGTIYCPCRSAR